jgi:hypothetical protein
VPQLLSSYHLDEHRKACLVALRGHVAGDLDAASVRATFTFPIVGEAALSELTQSAPARQAHAPDAFVRGDGTAAALPTADSARQEPKGASVRGGVQMRIAASGGNLDATMLLNRLRQETFGDDKLGLVRAFAQKHTFPSAMVPELLAQFIFDDERGSAVAALKGRLSGDLDETAVRASFNLGGAADKAMAALA